MDEFSDDYYYWEMIAKLLIIVKDIKKRKQIFFSLIKANRTK